MFDKDKKINYKMLEKKWGILFQKYLSWKGLPCTGY